MPPDIEKTERWGREALSHLKMFGVPSSDGECPLCLAHAAIGIHSKHCPLARLIEQGEELFKETT